MRAGCGQPESKPGGREPPPAWPWGVRWAELASDNEPNFVLARGLLAVGYFVTACCNAEWGRHGGDPLGRTHDGGGHSALHRARHMDPKASSTRDSAQWHVWRCGATICGRWEFWGGGGRRDDFQAVQYLLSYVSGPLAFVCCALKLSSNNINFK